MANLFTNIQALLKTRAKHADMMAKVLDTQNSLSETEFCNLLLAQYRADPQIHDTGWYDPPPGGVAALFAQPPKYERLNYGSLRKPESWPKPENRLDSESIGFIYGSPVDKATGIHGDISLTIYTGSNPKIQQHLANVLRWHEMVAEYIQVGMQFREIFEYSQSIMSSTNRVNGAWLRQTPVTTTTYTEAKVIGDTVPWSNEPPSLAEQAVIKRGNINELKELMRQKRIYVSEIEKFKVPNNIVVTIETNLEDAEHPELPLALFYMMAIFNNGQKQIVSNYQPIFAATGMNKFINSKY